MSVFTRRIRGFRLVDVVALGCLIALVFGVYLAKTLAGHERQEIARIEREIRAEKERIRLLQAEVAYLEQPERLERLSESYLGLKPVEVEKEAPEESLEEISRSRADKAETPPGLAPAAPPASAPAATSNTPVAER